jgi:high-affinity iron transporter
MFGAAIIVLRETFEAALLIGIVAAATRSIPNRGRWVAGGIVAGLAGAFAVAALTGRIAALFDGVGQELFNAAVLGIAVIMLGWHNVWMSAHAAELSAGARRIGREVTEGRRELSAILIVITLAVLREGSETALFLYGMMYSGELAAPAVVSGGAFGLVAGASLGVFLYAGLLRIPMKWFFRVTSMLILLLAAGMASRMAQFLIQADVLPGLASPLWDMSSVLPTESAAGALLHVLAGYDAVPTGMQVLFYVAVLVAVSAGMWWVQRGSSSPTRYSSVPK